MTATARAHEPTLDLDQPHQQIWHGDPCLDTANELSTRSLIGHLGIEFLEVGHNYLIARMPVDDRTRQPLGILHGGASVALAETLASWAAIFTIDHDRASCVGMEINANHIRPVTSQWVTGVVSPIALGRATQVWEVRITREDGKLACISRCTIAVIDRPAQVTLSSSQAAGLPLEQDSPRVSSGGRPSSGTPVRSGPASVSNDKQGRMPTWG